MKSISSDFFLLKVARCEGCGRSTQCVRPAAVRVLPRLFRRGAVESQHQNQRRLPLSQHCGASQPAFQPHGRRHGIYTIKSWIDSFKQNVILSSCVHITNELVARRAWLLRAARKWANWAATNAFIASFEIDSLARSIRPCSGKP